MAVLLFNYTVNYTSLAQVLAGLLLVGLLKGESLRATERFWTLRQEVRASYCRLSFWLSILLHAPALA